MKKKVIIILDKCESYTDLLRQKIDNWFPENNFDVKGYTRDSFRNMNINNIWMTERLPIVIGYGYGAVYLENVKNYSQKFLISPFWNENIMDSMFFNIDDYDRENTFCLFGNNPVSLKMAEIYKRHYPKTLYGLSEGRLDSVEGIEICVSSLISEGQ